MQLIQTISGNNTIARSLFSLQNKSKTVQFINTTKCGNDIIATAQFDDNTINTEQNGSNTIHTM